MLINHLAVIYQLLTFCFNLYDESGVAQRDQMEN